jgi:hypothetical protein
MYKQLAHAALCQGRRKAGGGGKTKGEEGQTHGQECVPVWAAERTGGKDALLGPPGVRRVRPCEASD